MISWILGWKEKAIALGVAITMFFLWILKVKKDAEAKGKREAYQRVNEETEKKKNEWQKIDDTPLSVDDALSRLRERASRSDGNS